MRITMKQKNKYCCYAHINKINNKVYIGITSQNCSERWRDGKGYKRHPLFYNAIIKYGWNNFEHKILKEDIDENEINDIEKKYIKEYNSLMPNGYNMTTGDMDFELYKITSKSVKDLTTNIIYPSEREASRILNLDPGSIGKNCKGLIRQVKGHDFEYTDKELYEKYKIQKELLNNTLKLTERRIINLDTKEIFNTMKEACLKYNLDPSNLTKCCKGKYKTTGGYHWNYLENIVGEENEYEE